MGNGEAATIEISENRLNIADGRRTLRRVAVMADLGRARKAGSHVFTDEIVADEAGMAFIVEEAGFLIPDHDAEEREGRARPERRLPDGGKRRKHRIPRGAYRHHGPKTSWCISSDY